VACTQQTLASRKMINRGTFANTYNDGRNGGGGAGSDADESQFVEPCSVDASSCSSSSSVRPEHEHASDSGGGRGRANVTSFSQSAAELNELEAIGKLLEEKEHEMRARMKALYDAMDQLQQLSSRHQLLALESKLNDRLQRYDRVSRRGGSLGSSSLSMLTANDVSLRVCQSATDLFVAVRGDNDDDDGKDSDAAADVDSGSDRLNGGGDVLKRRPSSHRRNKANRYGSLPAGFKFDGLGSLSGEQVGFVSPPKHSRHAAAAAKSSRSRRGAPASSSASPAQQHRRHPASSSSSSSLSVPPSLATATTAAATATTTQHQRSGSADRPYMRGRRRRHYPSKTLPAKFKPPQLSLLLAPNISPPTPDRGRQPSSPRSGNQSPRSGNQSPRGATDFFTAPRCSTPPPPSLLHANELSL
jgi:hypothetical protein